VGGDRGSSLPEKEEGSRGGRRGRGSRDKIGGITLRELVGCPGFLNCDHARLIVWYPQLIQERISTFYSLS
jgi:hypothetical protein